MNENSPNIVGKGEDAFSQPFHVKSSSTSDTYTKTEESLSKSWSAIAVNFDMSEILSAVKRLIGFVHFYNRDRW